MALMSAISAADLTAIRSDNNYRVIQYALAVPNDVVVQFSPSANPDTVFAEIGVGTVASGDMANVEVGQTVIFSTTTDYQATETYRTYVRKYINVGTLYVGENSQALTTSQYVTVIDTYEVHEKLRKSEALLDWDVTFRKLLPIETAIPSAVVISNGATSYQPPTNCVVMDADSSSISTYAWTSSNSNDSFSSTSVAQPTITLEAGAFRWLRVTFTDDTGLSNFRVFPCWTVPTDYSSTIATGYGTEDGTLANISYDSELGWTCNVAAFASISSLLNKTFMVIASDEWINDSRDYIRTNVEFVGYLQNENTGTSGNQQYGKISETSFAIEGFGHQLARQNIASVLMQQNATPTAWDEIKNPTPARMTTYRMTEYSTISTLCALSIPSDDTDFVGDDLTLDNPKLLDDIRFIAEVINAELQFDCDGKLDLCRNLNYLDDTARNAAATVATLSPSDFIDNYTLEYDYTTITSNVKLVGGAYDSTNDLYDLFEAIAPVTRYGYGDPLEIVNQVLTTDNTAAQSQTEIAERTANFLAYNNPTWTIRVTLKDEWWFAIPDIGSWWKFDISATDTVRGKVFDTNDRWQLLQINHSTNSLIGRRQVNATFRLETQSTGASVRANPIINDADADYDYVPAVMPPFSGYDNDLTDGNWWDDLDVAPPSDPNPVPSTCQLGGLRPKSGNIYRTDPVGTLTVNCRVRGYGVIGEGSWCYTWDFTQLDGGFVGYQNASQPIGDTYNNEWVTDNKNPALPNSRILSVRLAIPSADYTITDMSVNVNRSGPTSSENTQLGVANVTFPMTDFFGFSNPVTGSSSLTGLSLTPRNWIMLYSSHNFNNVSVRSFTLKGKGENPFGVSNCAATGVSLGDAFYYSPDGGSTWQAYGVGDGLYIEGSQPNIPPYNPEHEYFLPSVTVAGLATIEYEFRTATLNTAEFENWNLQMITCENP